MTITPLISGTNDPLNATANAVEFAPLQAGTTTWNASTTQQQGIISCRGVLKKLFLLASTDPLGTYTFAVIKNGVATLLTVALTSGNTVAQVVANVPVTKGDKVQLRCTTAAGAPGATPYMKWYTLFESTTWKETPLIFGGWGNNTQTASTFFCCPIGGTSWNATETNRQMIFATGGVLKDFYAEIAASPGAGITVTYTFRLNGATPAGTLTVSLTAATLAASDLTNRVVVAAGDRVGVQYTVAGGVATQRAAYYGVTFVPDSQDGDFVVSITNTTSPTDGQDNIIWDGFSNWAADATLSQLAPLITCKAVYVRMTTAPGANKTRTVTLQLNGVSSVVTASGLNVVNFQATGFTLKIPNGTRLNTLQNNTSGSSSTAGFKVGYLFNYSQPKLDIPARTVGAAKRLSVRFMRRLDM